MLVKRSPTLGTVVSTFIGNIALVSVAFLMTLSIYASFKSDFMPGIFLGLTWGRI